MFKDMTLINIPLTYARNDILMSLNMWAASKQIYALIQLYVNRTCSETITFLHYFI